MAVPRTRRWAAFALLLLAPITVVVVDALRPEPSGHWSGHLSSAAISAGVAVAVVIGSALVWRQLPRFAVAALVVTEGGLALETVGNVRVAQGLWATSYDDNRAAAIGPTIAGYEWGHVVAERGDTLVIAGAVAFAISLGVSRRVGPVIAGICAVVAFFPPWIYPAPGILILLAWLYAVGPRRGARPVEDRHDLPAPAHGAS